MLAFDLRAAGNELFSHYAAMASHLFAVVDGMVSVDQAVDCNSLRNIGQK